MPTLHWIGKEKVVNHHQDVPFRVLEHKYGFTADSGNQNAQTNSGNKIIHGDNLEALKALLPEYESKINCIYIDPPYNTGEEKWIYNDNVNDPKITKWLGDVVGKQGEDLSRHDKWLCMMYPRLRLLHKLLANDGIIFISIDENECANLKLLCNEIFGAHSFVTTFVWQKRYSRENRETIGDVHEYIMLYAMDKKAFKEKRKLVPMDEKQAKVYKNTNNDPKGRWRPIPMTAQAGHATKDQFYPIETPKGAIHYPPEGRCWSIVEETYKKLLAEGRIYFGKDQKSQPNIIRYLTEVEGVVPWTWWPHEEVGNTDIAKKEIYSILGKSVAFDTPKPASLIERILQISTDKEDIILDSFAGSGTTAHAVMNQNRKDKGNRKFILVEMETYAETITAERVRRVVNGYADIAGTGGSFDYYELGQPIFKKDKNLNEEVGENKIREYIYYTETRQYLKRNQEEGSKYLLDTYNDTGYYFYYEKDKLTTLGLDTLSIVSERADQYIIYADKCLLDKEYMLAKNIVFKKIPRDIKRF